MRLELRLPQLAPQFVKTSVAFAGLHWQRLYDEVTEHSGVRMLYAPEELGPAPAEVDAYDRTNLWLLYTALSYGVSKLNFLCLWDGKGGDGVGGVQQMRGLVQRFSGREPEVIRPQELSEVNR